MNILYLAHRIPYPPNKGDKLRSFRQLQHLADRHRVWCACFVDDPADLQHKRPLAQHCEALTTVRLHPKQAVLRGLMGLARGGTATESFYRSRAMYKILDNWSASISFDVVVAFSSSMAPYALQVPAKRHVLDLCDLDSRKWFDYARRAAIPIRWLYRMEGRRLADRERAWIDAFDAAMFITESEAGPLKRAMSAHSDPWALARADMETAKTNRVLKERTLSERIHIVGNGVDLPDLQASSPLSDGPGDAAPTVGFVGMMNYRPNVEGVCWFVSQCWPAIRAACPGVRFRIVGRSPTRRIRRLASTPGVTVAGEVDDVGAELRRFDVSVAPLRIARGLQNKVLEAMAWGKPVVLTPQAAEGVAAEHGREFIVAEDAEATAKAVLQLLCDPGERLRLGSAARRFAAERHRWSDRLRDFEFAALGLVERSAFHSPPSTIHQQTPSTEPTPQLGH